MATHAGPTHHTRRKFLRTAAGAALALSGGVPTFAPKRVSAQTVKPVRFTLAWLDSGANVFIRVAAEKGFFRKRGIEWQMVRGFGSVAAAQAVGTDRFDFGLVTAGPLILASAQSLPLVSLATADYESSMGIAVLRDSPIKTPKDLEGKKIGTVPTSGEYPFLPGFAKAAGFDVSKVTLINLDPQVKERALIDRQVDAITGFAGTSVPVFEAQKVPFRFMLFSKAGFVLYGQTYCTQTKRLKDDPALCEAVIDGLMEGMYFTLTNPDESIDIFLKAVPEIGLSSTGREFARFGLGLWSYGVLQEEARTHGFGYQDPKKVVTMVNTVMDALGKPGMTKPDPSALFDNRFVGKQRLTEAQWKTAVERAQEFGKYFA